MAQRRQKGSQKLRSRSSRQTVESLRRALKREGEQREQALEQQTATAEILRIISRSPTDVQPVLDAVAASAARLCGAVDAIVMRVDGNEMRRAAHFGIIPSASEHRPITPDTPTGRAILQGQTIHVADICEAFARGDYLETQALQRATGFRTVLSVPLMREDIVAGAVTIRRIEMRPFGDKEIALLRTFADQAVIAIENTRLFNELKESNSSLREALEQQTATADILKVISGSPTDVQPVFDTIIRNAVRLGGAHFGAFFRFDGELVHLGAHHNLSPEAEALFREAFPQKLSRDSPVTAALVERAPVNVPDIQASAYSTAAKGRAQTVGHRSILTVPLMRAGVPIGTIGVGRREPGSYPEVYVALLKTFADQAVIAIENVRLFNETKEALERQTATSEILRVISSFPGDVQPVFDAIAAKALELCRGTTGWVYTFDGELIHIAAAHSLRSEALEVVRQSYPMPPSRGGATARAILSQAVVYIPNVAEDRDYALHALAKAAAYSSIVAVPMLLEAKPIGVITVTGEQPRAFSPGQIELLQTFADQAVIAIRNVQLFRQIQEKSAQLEVANKHKSEFLANMSHELRTPLNAIIGFSEAMMEKMFGELNEKQLEYQKDIHESGKHLLSLINDILDLSKIEAGRMELELSTFHLPTAVSNAVTLIRERAQRHGIALGIDIDQRLGEFEADERKVKQIMLNLLSNAVKFTPDGGRVDVMAKLHTDQVEIAVKDTGVGISAEDQASLFEEFKQLGDSSRKTEGTGLGLALTKRLVELHGGHIVVDSAAGKGSTFRVVLPVCQ